MMESSEEAWENDPKIRKSAAFFASVCFVSFLSLVLRLAAFYHALRQGTQLLELDVYLTKDKQVVVSHDRSTGRVGISAHDIPETLYSDLPRVQHFPLLPAFFHPPHISLEYTESRPTDKLLHMPLLEEVFETFPKTIVNIDCKQQSPELCEQVAALVQKHRRQHLTVWGSFSHANSERLFQLDPSVPLIFSAWAMLWVLFAYFVGFLPFIRLKASYFEVPLLTRQLEEHITLSLGRLTWKRRLLLAFARFLTTRKLLFAHLKQRGIRVLFWVLNTEREFDEAFALGADGIITDFPTRLSKYLQARACSSE